MRRPKLPCALSYVHEPARVCTPGGTGTAFGGAGLGYPRPGVAELSLLESTPFPSTSGSSRKDGFRSGSQSGCVIYRRIICLDVNNLGVCWQRVGEQLPCLLLLHLCCLGRPPLDSGCFPGLDSSPSPCPPWGIPAPPWAPSRGVPSMPAVPHHPW